VTLWQARLGATPAEALWRFTESLSFDRRLAADDLEASAAHVRGLGRAGILTPEEVVQLEAALATVARELAEEDRAADRPVRDEDIHSLIERRVTEIAGEVGAKLHTGRSRNDQVATALRLYCRRRSREVAASLLELARVLGVRAEECGDAYLPGYTHLQRAQPVTLGHHLLAHGWAIGRDLERLRDARRRLDTSPLGAGALAGSSLGLDPAATAEELGFAAAFENSMDAVSDRDFVAELLFVSALAGVHLSRLGEEVVLWTTTEFGFLRLADEWATGSSLLPQKKNPDVAELARGKAGRLIGHLAGFLATLKSLPLAYNRDLQEDKEPLFDALAQVELAGRAMAGLLRSAEFDTARMAAAVGPESQAVDLAEWLVRRGVPFRRAHGLVGRLVREAEGSGRPLAEVVAAAEGFGPEAADLLLPAQALAARRGPGTAGPEALATELVAYRARLETLAAALDLEPRDALDRPGERS